MENHEFLTEYGIIFITKENNTFVIDFNKSKFINVDYFISFLKMICCIKLENYLKDKIKL